jgi:hypothetical protein
MTVAQSPKNASAYEYQRGLDSCIRTIALAGPNLKLLVFKSMAKEAAGYVRKGGLEKANVVDRLNDAALSNGLTEQHGQDVVQAALAEAFTDSPASSGHDNDAEVIVTPPKARFPLIRFADLKVSTSPSYLINGLIPRVGLTIVWGPPKCGKSFWTTDAMLHLAMGLEYRKRKVFSGPVVYCAFEGAEGYGRRAEGFRKHHQLGTDFDPPFFLIPARMNFIADHAALAASIAARIKPQKPVAVVLDTLNRSLHGSESSDEDMANYIRAADAVRETFDCAVIIVHHCGIDGTRPRGHTSLTGAVNAQLACRRDAGNNIVVEVEWMKDGPEGAQIVSGLEVVEVGTDDDDAPITSCVVVPVDSSAATPMTRKVTRMPKAAYTALRALREALDECGVMPPASNHIPERVHVVTVEQWRQYAYRMGISTSPEERAKQQAFKRASEHLIGGEHVGVWDHQVWLTS